MAKGKVLDRVLDRFGDRANISFTRRKGLTFRGDPACRKAAELIGVSSNPNGLDSMNLLRRAAWAIEEAAKPRSTA
jgi:hypothetical protein